ncbi:B-cell receptor CD22, partial [Etheostoma spectabile]|uniref:B-cell receptor CD22 n=1 Tax=Etheostoma spectabile TaxID=54343 RepID=UPI0013AF5DDC
CSSDTGSGGLGVTYTSTHICAVKGSTVEIPCSYKYPYWWKGSTTTVETKLWFTKWKYHYVPVDLKTESEYSGRVQYSDNEKDCTLRISDLRESDSAVYKFRFTTNQEGGRYTGSPGVTLSVTALQVQVIRVTVYQSWTKAELKCLSSCSPAGPLSYVWFNNERHITWEKTSTITVWFGPTDVFSCAVKGHEKSPSPSVLIQGQVGWGVTYTSTHICAVKGSTVDITCSYTYPYRWKGSPTTVKTKLWFTKMNSYYEPVDLKTDSEYSGRVQYSDNKKDCTLRISDLRESDSAVYKFRFTTNQEGGRYTGSPGVTLSVTGLQVIVKSTWLECRRSCHLPNNPSYVWYKNGQEIQAQTLYYYYYENSYSNRYSCALQGYKEFPSPSVLIQGRYGWGVTYTSTHICAVKGSTVEITCSYTYPSRENVKVEKTFWFTKLQDKQPVDLRTDSDRVQYDCKNKVCTLRISDLRESDSAVYKFRFTTNQDGGRYTGSPGVTLSVTGFQVQKHGSKPCFASTCTWAELKCQSSCFPDHSSYIWYKNGEKINEKTSSYSAYFYTPDSYSCSVNGYKDFSSPSVCGYGDSCNRVTYTERSICAFKGSSVNISCTYKSLESFESAFWFSPERSRRWKNPSQPEDLSKDSQYEGRVQVEPERGRSTLRISDLRESDSAEYHFKFITRSFEWRSSLPGTTLTVTDPDVQVQVIWSSTGPKLICHSSCLTDRPSYLWYKNETKIQGETSPSYGGHVDPADSYSCAYQSYRSTPVYAPKLISVLRTPPGDIMKNNSVTLTCSSDANPAAKYTWYKGTQRLLSEGPQLVFSSIQPSNSGQYYCTAHNELGRTSESVFINVKYGPKRPSVSVSPSAEIVEGSSVTLTCSSDANPAANYTWYKENQKLLQGPESIYHFSSISSEDRGNYQCTSENQFGRTTSTSLVLDVQYGPKRPSVSVSPSAEIVEGSSVNLTCSSDANPAANYTWYKENEDSPKASGQIFTITDVRPEHSGDYSCEAQNRRGRQSSTLHLTVAAGAWKSASTGTITVVLLAILLLAAFLWFRRKNKSVTQQSNDGERPDNRAQINVGPAATQRQPAEQEDDLNYSSICFPQGQGDALYTNIRPHQPRRRTEDQDDVDYTTVNYTTIKTENASSAPGTRCQGDGEDVFALYSTVKI